MEYPSIALYALMHHPATPAIRQILRQTLMELDLPLDWNEYYPGQLRLPGYLQNKEAPLLIVNEQTFQLAPGTIHVHWIKEKIRQEALSNSTLTKRLQRKQAWEMHLSLLLNLFIAFFPKCPLCWAAYLSLIGLAGAHSIAYRPWFLPLAVLLLMVNLCTLYLQRKGRPLKPFWLSLAGSVLIVVNRLYFLSTALMLLGASALLLASLWSALTRRMELTLKYHVSRMLGKLLAPCK